MQTPEKKLTASFLLTNIVLAFLANNFFILIFLLLNWFYFLRPFQRSDGISFLLGLLIFMPNNILAVKAGTFYFTRPDFLGLPVWEFFMWGYYFILLERWSKAAPTSKLPQLGEIILGLVFGLSFAVFRDKNMLLAVTSGLLLFTLCWKFSRWALASVLIMFVMGTIIEFCGLYGGHWGYAQSHYWGLPLWYLTMWGGTGLFYFHLGRPLVRHFSRN